MRARSRATTGIAGGRWVSTDYIRSHFGFDLFPFRCFSLYEFVKWELARVEILPHSQNEDRGTGLVGENCMRSASVSNTIKKSIYISGRHSESV